VGPCRGLEETLEPLNPKQIQARVRAGASAETIAAETGWALDRVIRYAGPPLAERGYVAERASKVEIRRNGADQVITLAESVDRAFESLGLYPDEAQWDSWRRVDGKWIVSVTHPGLPAGAIATWTYDHVGRTVHPLDELSRRLMGASNVTLDEALGIPEAEPEPEPEQRPRLVSVARPTAGAPAEPAEDHARTGHVPTLSRQPTVTLPRESTPPSGRPTDAQQAPAAARTTTPIRTPAGQAPPASQPPASQPTDEGEAKPKPKGKGRRASVPSWDEILFGATRGDDT
jgi:hypothetical protein